MRSLYAHIFTFCTVHTRTYRMHTHSRTCTARARRNVIGLPPSPLCKFAHACSYPSTVHTFPARLYAPTFPSTNSEGYLSLSLPPLRSLHVPWLERTRTALHERRIPKFTSLRKISAVCSYPRSAFPRRFDSRDFRSTYEPGARRPASISRRYRTHP